MNAAQKERIKSIAERVLKTFGACYLRAYKIIAIRDAKAARAAKKEENSSEEEPKQLPSTPEDPHRPRSGKNKYMPEIKETLKARITTWYTIDYDVDPYIAYLVESSIGDRRASVYRRFNAFKALNNSLPKSMSEAKKLFPAAKAFEGRQFSHDYVYARKAKLQSFLDAIVANEEMWKDEKFIEFLGLTPSEDPRGDEIFDLAFELTKWRLWIWKRIPYDKKEEALSKLVVEEIKREMWPELTANLPNIAQVRKIAVKTLYQAITAAVTPPVSAGLKVALEALEPVKPKIDIAITQALDKILETEDQIKKQLSEKIVEALKPAQEQLSAVVAALGEKIIPNAIEAFNDLKPAVDKVQEAIMELAQGKGESVEEIEKANAALLTATEERIARLLKEIADDAVKAAKAKVNLEPLMSALDPFDKLSELLKPFLALFPDISPHCYALKSMVEYRTKLFALDDVTKQRDEVEDLLDREEGWVLWRNWWTESHYRGASWSVYYLAWGIPELSATAYAFRQHGCDLAKLHKKFMKKWSFTFGDYLHEGAKTADASTWPSVITSSFVTGYTKALEYFKPRALGVLSHFIQDFVYRMVGTKLESFALKAIDPAVQPLASSIPSPVNEVIEAEQVATEAVRDALHEIVEKMVNESLINPAVKAWAETSVFAK